MCVCVSFCVHVCVSVWCTSRVQNLKLVKAVKEMADRKGIKPGQLALAWVQTQVRPEPCGHPPNTRFTCHKRCTYASQVMQQPRAVLQAC